MRGSNLCALAIAAFTITSAEAQERFTPPFGGSGGQQFISRCPANTLLTGVSALTGAYINGIAPICDGRLGPGAGGGGDKRSAECPAGSVVVAVEVTTLRSDNHLVKNLNLACADRRNLVNTTAWVPLNTPGAFTTPLRERLRNNPSHYPEMDLVCPNQDIIGLQGRAGVSIDALGLICGPKIPR